MLLVQIALLLLAPGSAAAQNYQFIHYSTAAGLPQQRVLSIYQDRQGYLWFGTESGVTRYDGAEYEIFTTAQGLAGNRVTAIAEDAAGRLLFGTSAGVSVYDSGGFQPLTWAGGRDDELIRALYTEADGRIWVATDRGLFALPPSWSSTHSSALAARSSEKAPGLPSAAGVAAIFSKRRATRFSASRKAAWYTARCPSSAVGSKTQTMLSPTRLWPTLTLRLDSLLMICPNGWPCQKPKN